jgi:hypothetical protein
MSRYEFIAVEKARHSVVRLCRGSCQVKARRGQPWMPWGERVVAQQGFHGRTPPSVTSRQTV